MKPLTCQVEALRPADGVTPSRTIPPPRRTDRVTLLIIASFFLLVLGLMLGCLYFQPHH